jgi:putative oxidoreductase
MADVATTEPRQPRADRDYGASATDLAGRILLAAIFVSSGLSKLTGWPGVVDQIAAKSIPFPKLAGPLAIAVELGGAAALVTGFGVRIGALALGAFTFAATVLFHDFWSYAGTPQYTPQFINFMKNLAIVGGLLVVVASASRRRRDRDA